MFRGQIKILVSLAILGLFVAACGDEAFDSTFNSLRLDEASGIYGTWTLESWNGESVAGENVKLIVIDDQFIGGQDCRNGAVLAGLIKDAPEDDTRVQIADLSSQACYLQLSSERDAARLHLMSSLHKPQKLNIQDAKTASIQDLDSGDHYEFTRQK